MTRLGLFLFVFCAAVLFSACQTDRARPASSSAALTAAPTGGVSPDWRRERERRAIRGLRYDTGRVEIDESFAATVPNRGGLGAAEAEYARGVALLADNHQLEALATFTRAVIMAPDQAEFYAGLGRVLMYQGGLSQQAFAALRTGLDLDPNSIELHYLLADLYNRVHERAAAEGEYQTVLSLDPSNGEAHARLATLAYYDGDTATAWEHYHAAEALGGSLPTVLASLLKGENLTAPRARSDWTPIIGPQARMDPGGGSSASNETTLASVNTNPNMVIGAWNDWRAGGGTVRMGVGVSLDGGDTWTDFLLRPPLAYQSSVEGDPMTCYDQRTGTMWVGAISFAYNGGIFIARKNTVGPGFGLPMMAKADGSADKCWMAAGRTYDNPDQTGLYIAYNNGCLRSLDMGMSWLGPVSLGTGLGFLPRVGPGGELYVAYWDLNYGVRLKRSLNNGVSFTTHNIATRLDSWDLYSGSRIPGDFRIPELTYLAVDPTSGTLYCVYFDTTSYSGGNYNLDLYFCKSTDQGTSWTTPVIINGDSDPPGDQFFPWIEVDQAGRLHIVSYDSRRTNQNDNNTHGWFDAFYTCSTDGGATWSEYCLSPAPFDSYYGNTGGGQFMGDYLGLGFGGSRVYPCYASTQNLNLDIFTNVIVWAAATLGDLNCDGSVDFGDINPFVQIITDPAAWQATYPNCPWQNGDINEDGTVDFADINPFIALLAGT
jgi:Flp pilus assembly protein TadD